MQQIAGEGCQPLTKDFGAQTAGLSKLKPHSSKICHNPAELLYPILLIEMGVVETKIKVIVFV